MLRQDIYKRKTEETNPKELARYAYTPLIEGWCTSVGAKLTDKGAEVFCYTFGATNTGVGTKGTYKML